MAVFALLRRESAKASPQQGAAADTLSALGKLVVATAGADVSVNGEVLRVGGETQFDSLIRSPFTGTGLIVGKVGTGAGTGSTLQLSSHTTAQRNFLTPAAGMRLFTSDIQGGIFQNHNGDRWGDEASNNFQATTDPAVGDDNTQGYSPGALWLNTTTQLLWTCLNATTGAAVWQSRLRSAQATVDFGTSATENDTATVTIADTAVSATTKFALSVMGGTADHDTEDAAIEDITAVVTNIVVGTSYDVIAYAPNGTWGRYLVNVLAQQ